MKRMTDIVLCTKDRLGLLKQSLAHILERTRSPYRLFVIDDASSEGNAEYLQGLWANSKLAGLVLRREGQHIASNWNIAPRLAQSEVMVFTDDDLLCPNLEPDWMARGLAAMAAYRKLGMLALNNPACTAVHAITAIRRVGPITICDRVGAHLAFIRRDLMRQIVIPEVGGELCGMRIQSDSRGLDRAWSRAIQRQGYAVAYLSDVYCWHIGSHSVRNGQDLSGRFVTPIDEETLEPPHGMRGGCAE